jgi:hypothetical protein
MSDPVETTETAPVEEEKVETPVEKEETPAEPVEGEEPKAEEDKDKKPEPKPAEEPKKKSHDQIRWERVLKERAEFKAKAEWLEQQINQQRQTQAQSPTNGRPARDKYESDEDYVDALTTWKVEQKLSGVEQKLTQHQEQTRTQTEWVSKINQARTDYPDYDTAMEEAQDIPVSESMKEAIQSSDLGADIAYYLARNHDEAERINTLSPMAAAREIGRIESYVEYEKTQKGKKPPVSKAPSPIKPVHSSSGSGTKSLEDMTPAEFIAFRNKQQAKKR